MVVCCCSTVVSILTSLPNASLYDPTLPVCLPFVWVIWRYVIRRFCTDGLPARATLNFLHATFGFLVAFHCWTTPYREIVMGAGAAGLLAIALFGSLALYIGTSSSARMALWLSGSLASAATH